MQVIEKMTKAFHEKNIEGIMAVYEKNATIVFEPKAAITHEEAVINKFNQMFMRSPQFTHNGHQVFLTGDTALHISPWQMNAKTPDGHAINENGLSIPVLKKQKKR